MRAAFISSFVLMMIIGCKHQKESKSSDNIEIVDTQMAELKKSPRLSTKDSLQFLKFWNVFHKLLNENDTINIAKLSLKNVYCPVYSKTFNYYKDSKLVPLWLFVNAPYKQNYITAFSSYLNKDTPAIYYDELDYREVNDLGFDTGKTVYAFSVTFNTEEIAGNYKLWKSHEFKFMQGNGSFKFMGLKVEENGSQYQWKLMSFDSLYFPLYGKVQDSLINFNSLDTFKNRFYSQYLLQFKEPKVYIPQDKDETYRFLWLRSFDNPVVVRFQKYNNTYTLYTKEMLDNEGYAPQQIKVNTEEKMSPYEWNSFKEKINNLDFWNVVPNDPGPGVADGALWILEGSTKNKYHFAERHSPADDKFRACCKYLLSLTKLNIPEKEQY